MADIATLETNDDDDNKLSETSDDNFKDDNSEKNEDDDDKLEVNESIESSSRSIIVVRSHSSPCLSVKCSPPSSESELPLVTETESANKEDNTLTKADDKKADDTTALEVDTTLSKVVNTDVVVETHTNETTTSLEANKDTTITEPKTDDNEPIKDNPSQLLTANDPPPPPPVVVQSTTQTQALEKVQSTNQEVKRKTTISTKRGDKVVDNRRKNTGTLRHTKHSPMSIPKTAEKQQQKTVGSTSSKLSLIKTNTSRRDLLARFKEYNDSKAPSVRPASSSSSRSTTRYDQLAQHSPKNNSRQVPSITTSRLRKSSQSTRSTTESSLHSSEATEADGIQVCSVESTPDIISPRNRAETGLLKKRQPPTSPRSSKSRYPRSVLPLLFDILRIATICFSVASLVSRLFTMFAGKMQTIYHIYNNPILWTVRWYLFSFQVLLITVELNVGIPGVIPTGTLDNFFHKSHIMGFTGALDLLMNTNKSLVDIVDILQDGSDPKSIQIQSAFVVLGVVSRGLMTCSTIYLIFALFGFNGESRRKLARSSVGLIKSP